nr:SpaH/EbpB family LPXTG-anchored major pilin [Bifidobacterium miconisargentati]
MKKIMAGFSAAAMLLSGMVFAAGTANASDTEFTPTELSEKQTITVKGDADSISKHTFKAVPLAAYTAAGKDDKSNISGVYLETKGANSNLAADKALYVAIIDSLNSVDEDSDTPGIQNGYTSSEYVGNPIGYVAAHYLGYLVRDNRGNLDITSSEEPYEGLLRDFVTALAKTDAFRNAIAAATVTGGDNATEAVLGSGEPADTNPGLVPGLYAVTDITENLSDGSTASIPMIVGTQIAGKQFDGASGEKPLGVVNVKPNKPTIAKKIKNDQGEWGDYADCNIGDTVNYRITGKVPNTTGYDKYTYKITDTLSKGLTLLDKNSSSDSAHTGIVVTATRNGADTPEALTEGTDYAVTVTANDDGTTTFTIDLTGSGSARIKSLAYGTDIVVTYSAILNQNAVIGVSGNPNDVKLEYSNNPGSEGTGENTPESPKVYTYQFDFTKTNVKETEKLNGAEFKIFKKGSDTPIKFVKDNSGNPNTAGQYFVAKDQNVTVDNKAVFDTVTSQSVLGENGRIWLGGLDAGTYVVKETKAPAGYQDSILAHFEVTIIAPIDEQGNELTGQEPNGLYKPVFSKDATWDLIDTDRHIVKNAKTIGELPKTGGAGIALFVVVAALLAGAGVTVFLKSRKTKAMLNA